MLCGDIRPASKQHTRHLQTIPGDPQCQGDRAHLLTRPNDSGEAEGPCNPEGPDRDHSGPTQQLSPLHKGEPQDRQRGRCANGGLEFSLIVDSSRFDQTYSWPESGLCLYLPNGPLPNKVNGEHIHLRTDINCNYIFPSNSKLVSAIYCITSDLSIEVAIKLQHCYRGPNFQDLAFVYCESCQPPFYFKIASQREYSFTAMHGTVKTRHFSRWAIVWLQRVSEWFKRAFNWFRGNSMLQSCIKIKTFYIIHQSHLRVDLVFLKGLDAHSEVHMYVYNVCI